jgi:hypothetical protein
MTPGDLVQFIWPDENMEDIKDFTLFFDDTRVGLVLTVFRRPDDTRYGDEILVYHDNEKWSVPETCCRRIE